ncbi:MAG: hypothetical protein Q4E88_01580 [Coriobacteriia bacterium]|nr:hypothetical protein [Coriobacteriia bacterium]
MDKKTFRKEAIDSVSTPYDINDYIRIAQPSTWIILFAIILFLVGALCWGYFGRLYSYFTSPAVVEDNQITSVISDDYYNNVQIGTKIVVDDKQGEISEKSPIPETATELLAKYNLNSSVIDPNDKYYIVKGHIDTSDGSYQAQIVTKEHKPIEFLFN